MATTQKKASERGLTLILWDESGISLMPNVGTTWAPVGETPVLLETPGRHNHTMLGFITRSPRRHDLDFRFTVFKGSANTEDMIFFLTEIHHYYRSRVMIVWDHLSAHHAAELYFEEMRPNWFEFHYFPSYSPELNPVEPCWNQIKNVYLANFVPANDDELVSAVLESGERINEQKLLPSFFAQAGIRP